MRYNIYKYNKIEKAINLLKNKGFLLFLVELTRYVKFKIIDEQLLYYYFKKFKSNGKFNYNGNYLPYFQHKYNIAYLNERAVEVSIIKEIIEKNKSKKILEVGNVMQHYLLLPSAYDILDKYEKGKNVINIDVVDYHPKFKYDLIVSISTIEHIGFDDDEQRPGKIIDAVQKLSSMLEKGGKFIFTVPLGYNKHLDKMIKEKKINFDELHLFKKISKDNLWVEEDLSKINNITFKYDFPYRNANWLLVAIIRCN